MRVFFPSILSASYAVFYYSKEGIFSLLWLNVNFFSSLLQKILIFVSIQKNTSVFNRYQKQVLDCSAQGSFDKMYTVISSPRT